MKLMDIAELNKLYRESELVDKDDFAEKRSNVLLSAGDHYSKKSSKGGPSRVRNGKSGQQSHKLRITKNNIYRVVKTYANSIISKVPGVTPAPKNESEMQDRKSAELNKAVWQDIKERHKLNAKFAKYAHEFVEVGEHAVKISWDPTKGELKGYAPKMKMDRDGNEYPEVDEMGEMLPDDANPLYSGDWNFESIHGFNLLRDPAAESMGDSPYLIIRKMMPRKELEKMYAHDVKKLKMISDRGDETFVVFDADKGKYEKTKTKVLIKEVYFRPSYLYPQGYFYIHNESGVLEHGELPKGLFPIVWVGFDEFPTSARARSIIKVARPYQAEINRASSQEATHQVTLGDDKLIYQSGSSLAQGTLLPGVRGLEVTGPAPTIMPGRVGSQFTEYIATQRRELYEAVFLDEIVAEKMSGQDPYAMLFMSMKQKAVFQPYIEKFQNYLIEICELTLELAKYYLPDDALVYAVGRNEQVNIPEFRNTTKLCYQMTVEAVSDDMETIIGRQLTSQHILQYVGKSLDPSSMGKLLKNMPFANNEDSFSEMTIDEDNVTNDMLLIERGGMPTLNQYDNNKHYIKKLTHRMKQPDFQFLNPQVQNMYSQFVQAHQGEETRKLKAIQAAKDGFVPTGGALVTCAIHVQDPEDPTKTKQLRLPYESLMALVKRLEEQGKPLKELEKMNQGALEQMANQMVQGQPQPPQQISSGVMQPQI